MQVFSNRQLLVCLGSVLLWNSVGQAQPPFPESRYYQPLNQHTPPGMAGVWAGALGRGNLCYFQPVEITVEGGGKVTFIDASNGAQQTLASPARAGLAVGPLYRVRISDMPAYPGVELYPSIELIDRLHPPAHLKHKYPVPIQLTQADLQQAVEDQLVTKIVYIEQPDLAAPVQQTGLMREEKVPQSKNLMTEADLRGRPVLYLRVGGRIPSPQELRGNPYTVPGPVEFYPPASP